MPGSSSWSLLGAIGLYLGLTLATTSSWEWTHDEALTFDVAVRRAPNARALRPPVPIGALVADLAVAPDAGPRDLVDHIGRPGVMFHPPAYYLGLQAWARAFGTSRWSLRVPAMLFGLLALVGLRRCARHLLPWPGADGAAGLLLATSPWFVYQSVNARPYALALCLAIWSTAAVLEIGARRRAPGWRVAFVALSFAGISTLYHYAFVLAWQGLLLLLGAVRRERDGRGRRLTDLTALAAMVVAIAVAYLPWLPSFRSQLAQADLRHYYFSGAIPLSRWPAALGDLDRQFRLGRIGEARGGPGLTWALALLGGGTLALLVAHAVRGARPGLSPIARRAWIAAPLLPSILIALDAWRDMHSFFIGHTNFALLPCLILLVAGAWTSLRERRAAVAGLAAWIVLGCAATVSEAVQRATTSNAFEVVARAIAADDDARHLVAVSAPNRGYLLALLLELRDAGARAARLTFPAVDPDAFVGTVTDGADFDRVTLVDFDISYTWGEQGWGPEALERAAQRARAAGWDVQTFDPRAGPAPGTASERQVRIADAVPVRY